MSSFFEGLIQNIPAIFYRCHCDEQWTMLFINEAIEKLTGYPPSDFINNNNRAYSSIIHPADIKKSMTPYKLPCWRASHGLLNID